MKSVSWVRRFRRLSAGVLLVTVACVSTPFKGVNPADLSNDQLLEELTSVYRQLGLATSSIATLRAMMPSQAIVLTAQSFTTFYGTATDYGSSTVISGTAVTTTHYQAYDQNETQRQINQLAQNIQLARINQLDSRRVAIESEVLARIRRQQQAEEEVESQIRNLFSTHPDLVREVPLLQIILPWEQKSTVAATLAAVGSEAESMLADRAAGLITGRWYGTLQWSDSGATLRVRGDLVVRDDASLNLMSQFGNLTIDVSGAMPPSGDFSGQVVFPPEVYRAAGPHVVFASGRMTPSEIRLRFTDSGQLTGLITLVR